MFRACAYVVCPLNSVHPLSEFNRECLAIDVVRQLTSGDVLHRLVELFVERGPPDVIRFDNGPEFAITAVCEWLEQIGLKTLFIEAGSP